MYKIKYKKTTNLFITIVAISLLSAGCTLFSKAVAAGVVKTVNGGADWQFSNTVKDSQNANLAGLNVAKFDFDPQNRETVYMGSYTGGLYKSEDSGASWKLILSKILVYDFQVHPGNSRIIYAAGMYNGQGKVLKTTDGGASWEEIYNNVDSENAVRAFAIDPGSTNQLLIGTQSGDLIRSADGGLSWKLAADFDNRIQQVFWRQDGIYVLLRGKGLYKGTREGIDFKEMTAGVGKIANSDLFGEPLTFNQAYIDPLGSGLLYVTTAKGVFKSTDGGANWKLMPLPVNQDKSNARPIAVAKTSSNIVYTAVGNVIYKSTDGGSTWQTQNVATTGYINYILIDPQLSQIAYAGVYVAQ